MSQSQSQSLLASLWFELEERNDTANILREILGQHTIELLTLDPLSQADVIHALRPIHWIKAVFDIQRAYQQAAAFPNVPGILPSELLYATLLHILEVYSKMFHDVDSGIDQTGYRLLTVHTFLSGFRLLILLHEQLEPRKTLRLQQALQSLSANERNFSGPEKFILSNLLPAALAVPSCSELQSGNAYSLSLRQMGLPTFRVGNNQVNQVSTYSLT
jgi:hypothetical protein